MAEMVNHPRHYNAHPSGVEAIEICEGAGFCVGSAIKYLFRCDEKGSRKVDLQKAAWYLARHLGNQDELAVAEELRKVHPRAKAMAKAVIAHPKTSMALRATLQIVTGERERREEYLALVREAIRQIELEIARG